jgi:peroxiredoxin
MDCLRTPERHIKTAQFACNKISVLNWLSAATDCSVVQVRMLADQAGELTKALGVELDSVDMLGNVRCKR